MNRTRLAIGESEGQAFKILHANRYIRYERELGDSLSSLFRRWFVLTVQSIATYTRKSACNSWDLSQLQRAWAV